MSTIRNAPGPNRTQRRNAPNIHGTKMFGGLSAEEVHAKHAFPPGAQCMGRTAGACTGQLGVGAIIIRSFASVNDLRAGDPSFDMWCEMDPNGIAKMLVAFRGPAGEMVPHVRIATVYACKRCAKEAEKAAAHGPSYYCVEIDRGPGPDKIVSGHTSSAADRVAEEMVERAVANMAAAGTKSEGN